MPAWLTGDTSGAGGVFGVSGWRLEDLGDLSLYFAAQRARPVIANIMDTQSSIPGGFKSDYTASPQTQREMVYLTASILQGHLSWPIVSGDWSSIQTQLMEDQLSARPAALGNLILGNLLNDIPAEPFLYVDTEGWKHDHESGARGLFRMHRRESHTN